MKKYLCGFCGTTMKYVGCKKRKKTIDYYFKCSKCKAEKCVIETYKDEVSDAMFNHIKDKTF